MLNPSKDAASARVLASTTPKEFLLVSGCSRVRAVSPTHVAIATLPNLNPGPTFCTWVCTTAVVSGDRQPFWPDPAQSATPRYTCAQWMVIVTCACGSNETGIRFMNPKGDCLATLDTNQVTCFSCFGRLLFLIEVF